MLFLLFCFVVVLVLVTLVVIGAAPQLTDHLVKVCAELNEGMVNGIEQVWVLRIKTFLRYLQMYMLRPN